MSWYPGKNIIGNIKERRAARAEAAETAANTDARGIDQRMYSGGFYDNPEDMGSLFTGLMGYFMGEEPNEEGNIDMKKVGKKMQDASQRKGLLQIIQDMMTDTPLEEPYKYDSMGSTAQERHLLKARNKYPKSAYTNPWLSSTASKQRY